MSSTFSASNSASSIPSISEAKIEALHSSIRLFLCNCGAKNHNKIAEHLDTCPYVFFERFRKKRALYGGGVSAEYLARNRARFFR